MLLNVLPFLAITFACLSIRTWLINTLSPMAQSIKFFVLTLTLINVKTRTLKFLPCSTILQKYIASNAIERFILSCHNIRLLVYTTLAHKNFVTNGTINNILFFNANVYVKTRTLKFLPCTTD